MSNTRCMANTTFCLSVYLLMGIWVASASWSGVSNAVNTTFWYACWPFVFWQKCVFQVLWLFLIFWLYCWFMSSLCILHIPYFIDVWFAILICSMWCPFTCWIVSWCAEVLKLFVPFVYFCWGYCAFGVIYTKHIA